MGVDSTGARLAVAVRRKLNGYTMDVSFEASSGVVALFGPSGAGKSLTLRSIAGIFRPDEGRIEVGGETLFDSAGRVDLPAHQRRVGYVPQSGALFPHLTVAENIAFGLAKLPGPDRTSRVDELLSLLELGGLAERRPTELSGGQQQRVALARALAVRPRVLLLDEPFAAIDGPLRRTLRRELLSLHRRFATPIVMATHDLDDARALGAWLVIIAAGRVQQVGPMAEVMRRPASKQVARIVDARNLLTGTVVDLVGETPVIDVGGVRLQAAPFPVRHGERVDLMIAPEAILLVRPDQPVAGDIPLIDGAIVEDRQNGPIHSLDWEASSLPLALEIEIAAGPYHELGVNRQAEWRVRVPADAVRVLGPH